MLFNPHPSLLVPDCPAMVAAVNKSQRRYEESSRTAPEIITSAALSRATSPSPGEGRKENGSALVRCRDNLPADPGLKPDISPNSTNRRFGHHADTVSLGPSISERVVAGAGTSGGAYRHRNPRCGTLDDEPDEGLTYHIYGSQKWQSFRLPGLKRGGQPPPLQERNNVKRQQRIEASNAFSDVDFLIRTIATLETEGGREVRIKELRDSLGRKPASIRDDGGRSSTACPKASRPARRGSTLEQRQRLDDAITNLNDAIDAHQDDYPARSHDESNVRWAANIGIRSRSAVDGEAPGRDSMSHPKARQTRTLAEDPVLVLGGRYHRLIIFAGCARSDGSCARTGGRLYHQRAGPGSLRCAWQRGASWACRKPSHARQPHPETREHRDPNRERQAVRRVHHRVRRRSEELRGRSRETGAAVPRLGLPRFESNPRRCGKHLLQVQRDKCLAATSSLPMSSKRPPPGQGHGRRAVFALQRADKPARLDGRTMIRSLAEEH